MFTTLSKLLRWQMGLILKGTSPSFLKSHLFAFDFWIRLDSRLYAKHEQGSRSFPAIAAYLSCREMDAQCCDSYLGNALFFVISNSCLSRHSFLCTTRLRISDPTHLQAIIICTYSVSANNVGGGLIREDVATNSTVVIQRDSNVYVDRACCHF